jgi:hypothetical protein
MKYTIELESYSLDELRDMEEELERFIYIDAKEEYIDLLLNQYRVMKLCFYKGLITDWEYGTFCFNICGAEDLYIEGSEPPMSYVELAEGIYAKAITKLESL